MTRRPAAQRTTFIAPVTRRKPSHSFDSNGSGRRFAAIFAFRPARNVETICSRAEWEQRLDRGIGKKSPRGRPHKGEGARRLRRSTARPPARFGRSRVQCCGGGCNRGNAPTPGKKNFYQAGGTLLH